MNVTVQNEDKETPEKPVATETSAKSITLRWQGVEPFRKDNYYELCYKEEGTKRWKTLDDEIKTCHHVVRGLKPNTKYVFKVRVMSEDNEGEYSVPSDQCSTNSSPAFRFVQSLKPIENGNPARYALQLKEIPGSRNIKAETKKFQIGSESGLTEKEKTILLVGATGTGKSTMVDGFMNYILGVEWDDPFRFTAVDLEKVEKERLKNQAHSQTQWITSYSILPEYGGRLSYRLNIIDTPGFGDTGGIEKDQQIIDQIRTLFSSSDATGVTCLDAVCFLVKAPDNRLTHMQRYIFESIMSLFGKDIEKNICYLVTFADGQEPQVLSALKESALPLGEHFLFNNSALFAKNVDLNSTSLSPNFWEMGLNSFELFFKHLDGMQTRSLQLTKQVLETRYQLEMTVKNIQPGIDAGLTKVDEVQKRIERIEAHNADIKQNANFLIEDEDTVIEPQKLPPGTHVTNCTTCNFTCHDNCAFKDDDEKQHCCAMSRGYCTACPNKCHWRIHKNMPYKYVPVKKKVMRTLTQMQQRYTKAKGELQTQEHFVAELRVQLETLCVDIEKSMSVVRLCNEQLNKIALRPNPLSVVKYIDLMIQCEEKEGKEGFMDRIVVLQEFRKRAEISSKLGNQTSLSSITKNDILSALSSLRAWFVSK